MLHPENKLTWLDITKDKVMKGSISDLFTVYADRVHDFGHGTSVIAFGAERGPKIKVQDWTGWTELQTIWKIADVDDKWVRISVKGHPEISTKVSYHELVPAYDITDTKIGFHGEVKYGYFLKNPMRFISSDKLRIRGIEDLFPDHPYFAPVDVEELDDTFRYGYHMYTVSSFLNMDNFHMYGSDMVDVHIISGEIRGYK